MSELTSGPGRAGSQPDGPITASGDGAPRYLFAGADAVKTFRALFHVPTTGSDGRPKIELRYRELIQTPNRQNLYSAAHYLFEDLADEYGLEFDPAQVWSRRIDQNSSLFTAPGLGMLYITDVYSPFIAGHLLNRLAEDDTEVMDTRMPEELIPDSREVFA